MRGVDGADRRPANTFGESRRPDVRQTRRQCARSDQHRDAAKDAIEDDVLVFTRLPNMEDDGECQRVVIADPKERAVVYCSSTRITSLPRDWWLACSARAALVSLRAN